MSNERIIPKWRKCKIKIVYHEFYIQSYKIEIRFIGKQ